MSNQTGAAPTHAGGIVFKKTEPEPEYLLIRARKPPEAWVFPKGHIESGESAQQAALREVLEEAGVRVAIVQALGRLAIGAESAEMFLMELASPEIEPAEREYVWLGFEAALRTPSFEESRELLKLADRIARALP